MPRATEALKLLLNVNPEDSSGRLTTLLPNYKYRITSTKDLDSETKGGIILICNVLHIVHEIFIDYVFL